MHDASKVNASVTRYWTAQLVLAQPAPVNAAVSCGHSSDFSCEGRGTGTVSVGEAALKPSCVVQLSPAQQVIGSVAAVHISA